MGEGIDFDGDVGGEWVVGEVNLLMDVLVNEVGNGRG